MESKVCAVRSINYSKFSALASFGIYPFFIPNYTFNAFCVGFCIHTLWDFESHKDTFNLFFHK